MDSSPMQSSRPLRPMSFGEILEGAFAVYRDNFQEFLSIAAVLLIPTIIVLGLIRLIVSGVGGPLAIVVGVLVSILLFAANILVSGALAVAIGRRYAGLPSTVSTAFRSSEGRFMGLLGTTLLYALLCWLMAIVIIGIPFAIYFGVRWALSAPVIMLEGTPGGMPTLRRSASLVSGHWWRTLGILIVAAIIVGIISTVITGILGAIIHNAILDGIIGQLIGVIATPFSASVAVLLYFDYRVRNEGYDMAALQGNLASNTGGATGPALQI